VTDQADEDRIIICRCRNVTLREVKEIIAMGVTDIETLKRMTKVGTGICQGKTCLDLLVRILARETGRSPEEVGLPTLRTPVVPVEMGALETDIEEVLPGKSHLKSRGGAGSP